MGERGRSWRVRGGMGVNEESLVGHASDACGKRFVGGCMRKGSEWWNEGGREKEGV